MASVSRHAFPHRDHAAHTRGGVQTILLGMLWLGAVIGGFAAALIHEQTPAASHDVVAHWPAQTVCVPPHDKPMLVVFIHPKCPCTRASRLLAMKRSAIETSGAVLRPIILSACARPSTET